MSQKDLISVIILAKNEEERIAECIKSVHWAHEVLVVDNGSTDDTIAIAKTLRSKVIERLGTNFSELREYGAKETGGTWLLYLDADERITEKLKIEILKQVQNDKYAGYYISRRNFYLGREWPARDKMVRLIKKDALISWSGKLHEHPQIQGIIGELKEPLIHLTHRTLFEMVEKTNDWSDIEADLRIKANHPRMAAWRFIRVMVSAFWRSYIKEGGWKSGVVGWIESIYQSFSMFITYAKLWERQNRNS
jgi:glycosyltransferase involved in cell wall biosynthesis